MLYRIDGALIKHFDLLTPYFEEFDTASNCRGHQVIVKGSIWIAAVHEHRELFSGEASFPPRSGSSVTAEPPTSAETLVRPWLTASRYLL